MTIDIDDEIALNTAARAEIKQLSDKVNALIAETATVLGELCRDARAKPVIANLDAAIKALRDGVHADCIGSIDRILTDEMHDDENLRDMIQDDIEASEAGAEDFHYDCLRDEAMMRRMGYE